MNVEKQKLLIEYTISSPDIFALCSSILKSDYFDPDLKQSVEFIHEYYEKYNTTPDIDQLKAEYGVSFKLHDITSDKIEYCSAEIEKFCKRRAIENAILSAPKLIAKGDYGKIEDVLKEALTTSLHRNLGIDFFDDFTERLEDRKDEDPTYSSGWTDFDEAIGGGLRRRTLTMLSANSGGGKSITLSNVGLNFMKQGLNVLYISLELYEDMVDDRYIQMFTGIQQPEFGQRIPELSEMLRHEKTDGQLAIKYMPAGTSSNDIRAYLKEFELKRGFVPDVLLLDYLDIMGSNDRISSDNVFEKDKQSTEQLRNILVDYDMIGLTASQQNRGAIDAEVLNQSHIAGGISKVNTVDNYVSIIMNDIMRAEGRMAMQFLKTRSSDGVGKTIHLKWDRVRLLISNADTNGPELSIKNPRTVQHKQEGGGDSLLDVMNLSS